MNLRNRSNGDRVTALQFRQAFPNTSFPRQLTAEIVNAYGYDEILPGALPTRTTPYETIEPDGLEEINGQWYTKYIIGPVHASPEEEAAYRAQVDQEAANEVKRERTSRLSATDWTQLGDSPVQPVNEWRVYRQALRDITQQAGYPHNIVWPEPPSYIER